MYIIILKLDVYILYHCFVFLQVPYYRLEANELWVIMEFCDFGNLGTFAEKYPMDLYLKLDILYQTSNALVYLLKIKSNPVLHCNLKPANILLKVNCKNLL